jgi:hypothetical protein
MPAAGEISMRFISSALLLATAILTASCGNDLAKTIEDLGHQELRPPTTLTPPGTIVVIRETGPVELAVVCTQDEVIKRADILTSRTQSVTLAEKTKATFKLGAEYLAAYGIDLKGSHLKRASLALSHAEVLEISDAAIEAGALDLGASCRRAIEVRRAHHRTVGMIKSALKANVVYTLEFDDTVDVAGKATLLSSLAIKLGGNVESNRQSTITGEGLYWGIRTDTDFFTPTATGKAAYGLPIPIPVVPPTLPEILAGRLLLPGAAPIARVEPKGTDALDYSP